MGKERERSENGASDFNIGNEGNWNQYGDNVVGNKTIIIQYNPSHESSTIESEKNSAKLSTLYDIEDRIKKVKKMSVFPWFRKTLSYNEAYPELFINPILEVGNKEISFQQLKEYKSLNLAITGEAGAGKTTLLRFFFAFCEHNEYYCLYFSAEEIKLMADKFEKLMQFAQNNNTMLLFCIDGVDEAFADDFNGYRELITRINASYNCCFWLGCRSDYYLHHLGDRTSFSEINCKLSPWSDAQSNPFIQKYSEIIGDLGLPEKIDNLLGIDPNIVQLKSNPFQLALLSFLAEESEKKPLQGKFDLYERFMYEWFNHEWTHGRCRDDNNKILLSLRKAARVIYDGGGFKFDEVANNNTAVSELLIVDDKDIVGNRIAHKFYHRSLAAFILAQGVIDAMLSGNIERLRSVLPYKLKDDVTNFIGDKFATLNTDEREVIKDTIQRMYWATPATDENLIIREQSIYFITRLGIDVTDFLVKIISGNPKNRIMRLTLAYGCVLSDNIILRQYALDYAESIYAESEDAITNRAWTVVYFADVLTDVSSKKNINPYTYKDTIKGSWRNARKARIKRFTRENPRLKDYRFRLFDIPLFYSFLKDRGWDELSEDELKCLETVDFPVCIFNEAEISFLEKVRGELVIDYRKHLTAKD